MWCWLPPQINTHQDSHELVTPLTIDNREHGFDAVSFRSIRTDVKMGHFTVGADSTAG